MDHSAVTDSERRFIATFEQAAVGIAHVAPDGHWLRVNRKLCEIVGYSRDELLCLRFQDITHPNDLDSDLHQVQRMLAGEIDTYALEKRYLRKDGKIIWINLTVALVWKTNHTPDYFISVIEDIQRRKESEQALEASEKSLRSLYNAMNEGVALHELVFDEAGKAVDYRILEVNPAYTWILGLAKESVEGRLASEVYSQAPPPYLDIYQQVAISGNGREFETDCIPMGKSFDISVFSPSTNRFATVFSDITERKQAEQTFRKTFGNLDRERGFLKSLIHTLPDLIWLKDPDGVYLACNPEFERLFGAPESQIIGKTDYDFVDKELADFFRAHDRLAMAAKGPSKNEERVTYASDGHEALLETTKTPMPDARGTLLGVLGIGHDITHRKRAEHALQRFATIFRHAGWGMVIADARSECITHVNPAFAAMHGYTEDELIGQPVLLTYAPEVRGEVPDFIREAHEKGHLTVETWHLRKDGSTFPCHLDVTVYLDSDGSPLFRAANVEDITEQRRTQLALEESAERYRSVIETSLDGYWMVDNQGCLVEVNDAYCRMSGYSRDELLAMAVHKLDAVQSEQEVCTLSERVRSEGSIIFESLHRRKDGETWDVEVAMSYAPIQGGRFFCFFRDTTTRKREQAMAALRQKLTELLGVADQNSIMRTALDTAEAATASEIGFFHFVEPNQETVSLQAWSTRTLSEMCFAEGADLHYPVSQAGVWVDCIYAREPVIHNDYAGLAHRKGMPVGHASVTRELTVPVMRDGLIVAVIGVGNKALPYTDRDVEVVRYVAEIAYDFVERRRTELQIQFMAYYDVLTKLPNRTLLSDRLHQAMAQSHRSGQLVGVCYLDLDGFKPVNDRYGHDVGDKLLVKLATNIKKSLREGDSLARMGGDEFIILLTGLASLYECEDVVERILTTIQIPIEVESHRIHLSASIGVTLFPIDASDADTLLRHADQAMYEAKATGKSKYRIYDPVEDQNMLAQRRLLSDFEIALHTDQLVLHYQPKIDLRNGSVVGVEALIRWNHPDRGTLYPSDFLPAIEDTPLELALGEWVVRNALDQYAKWANGGISLNISINISPRQMQIQEFADFLAKLITQYPQGAANRLEIEMLEIAAIGSIDKVANVMQACNRLGIHFSLDDFGTGYSSLTYFHQLPIDIVKIDQNFVREMLSNARDLDIVESVLQLSEALDRPVVAEGVESIEIGMMLLSLGCKFGQGYGIARPMEAERIASWLDQWQTTNNWSKLSTETSPDREHYDINVAIFSHKLWLERIGRFVRNEAGASLPQLDERECQLARWYTGVGRARYGKRPSYPFIQQVHHAVHQRAQQIVSHVVSGDRKLALDELRELHELGGELIALLKKVATQ